jgi:hypothetical protein
MSGPSSLGSGLGLPSRRGSPSLRASRAVPRFAAGNQAARKHGATSADRIAPLARNQKRRVLRRIGFSARDLDALARGYLDLYCRLAAKIELADRYIEEHGLLRADGTPQPVLATYTSWVNAARLALTRLEQHLRGRENAPALAVLEGEGRRLRLEAERRLAEGANGPEHPAEDAVGLRTSGSRGLRGSGEGSRAAATWPQ